MRKLFDLLTTISLVLLEIEMTLINLSETNMKKHSFLAF